MIQRFSRLLILVTLFTLAGPLEAQKKRTSKARPPQAKKKIQEASDIAGRKDLIEALSLAKQGQYEQASIRLFELSLSPRFRDKRMQIKYILGLMLYQMKLNQVSAFQFISVVKDGRNKYLKQALEKLSLAADALGDNTLLNYAISRVEVNEFPRVHRDMLYYRIGEYQFNSDQFDAATKSLARVKRASDSFAQAKYLQGLAFAEMNEESKAVEAFDELIESRQEQPLPDPPRVAGLLGKARTQYQGKKWDAAIETYRQVPRDSEMWHDTLFESSWAMLRSGKFRSALSNFQSLHSAYYEDFYLPESLLLRSIVYLYICKYDEMEKVLNLYQKIYGPVYKDVRNYLNSIKDPVTYFNDVVKVIRDYRESKGEGLKGRHRLPLIAVRKIMKEGDFSRTYQYIVRLLEERRRIQGMSAQWRNSAIGKYSAKVIQRRIVKARSKAGRQVRAHLFAIKDELFDLFEQEGFIRFEMLNGKKEALKKKVAGKDIKDETKQVDENQQRDYYVQNGYEYWPFKGEYWLDELGNYHYVGTQSCN